MSDSPQPDNPQDKEELLRSLLRNKDRSTEFFKSLTSEEKKYALSILKELSEEGRSKKLQEIYKEDYDELPPDIHTFVTDPYYMGDVLEDKLYPRWEMHMKNFLDPSENILEVALTGAIGTGKTTIGLISLLYHLCRTLCLKNPQDHYNLMSSDEIVFGIFNATLELADSVGFQKTAHMVKTSPFFKEKLIHNPKSPDQINFPKNIAIEVGSKFTHALGRHIFGAIIDEANFQEADLDDQKTSQIMKTYNALYRRMESRFLGRGGRIPGQLYLVSSKNEHSSFLEVHIEKHKDKTTTYVVDEPIWVLKKHLGIYSGETFRVMVGDQKRDSKILKKGETVPKGYKVIKVPIEYWESFDREIDNALKDIAGVATYGDINLIKNRGRVRECIVSEIKEVGPWESPFTTDLLVLDFDDDETEISDFMDVPRFKKYLKKVGYSRPRAVHIDIGISGDALGMAMGHIAGHREIEETTVTGETIKSEREVYRIDLMARATNIDGKELPLIKILTFVKWLRELGISIRQISTDGYQSTFLRQLLRKQGFETRLLSIDKDDEAYIFLKDAFLDRRVQMYEYEVFLTELFDLIHDKKNKRVDHPKRNSDGSRGSKDVSDSVAGVVSNLVNDEIQIKESDQRPIDYGAFLKSQGRDKTEEEEVRDYAIGDYLERLKQQEEPEEEDDDFMVF